MAPPHVVMFPLPAQGHIPPMLRLADLISSSSDNLFFITFINTEHAHGRLLRNSPAANRLAALPNFRFRTLPDGLPVDDPRPFHKLLDLVESMTRASAEPYRELLRNPEGWPPVSCVVADGVLPLALDVPDELRVPVMILRTSSACSLWSYCCIPQLIERGEVPIQDGADLDEPIHGVKGMENFLRRRDLPSMIRNAESVDDPGLQYANAFTSNLTRARALILNTFDSLEPESLSHIRSTMCPVTYTIGPLHTLTSGLACSLWPQEEACLTWLDAQPDKSVVYVSFGSSLVMSREEFVELRQGLIDSGHRFLWVVRPDSVEGLDGDVEPVEGRTEKGWLTGWAPQEEVLAHPAVGCFLTHSGWNSTMEGIAAGVPMICRPFFVDQMINSRFVSEVWKVGVDVKDVCRREVVERMVREVMEGEKAGELRRAAGEEAEMAKRSVVEGGTSYENLHKLIQHIKSLCCGC